MVGKELRILLLLDKTAKDGGGEMECENPSVLHYSPSRVARSGRSGPGGDLQFTGSFVFVLVWRTGGRGGGQGSLEDACGVVNRLPITHSIRLINPKEKWD